MQTSHRPREFLKDFSGTVVTDGYQVYHKLADEREDLKVAGCWIHARRPFADFIKSVGLKTAKGTVAQEAYDMITDILHTDNEFDDLSTLTPTGKSSVRLNFRRRLTLISNG